MEPREVAILVDYNYWANHKVVDAAAALTPEQFVAPGRLSFGSVRGTLVHVLMAEHTWRRRIQDGVSERSPLQEREFTDLRALKAHWDEEEAALRRFVRALTPERLAKPVDYTATNGQAHRTPLWQILVHVVNHGTQFRGEAGVLLSELGHSPGDLDFIQYVRRRS